VIRLRVNLEIVLEIEGTGVVQGGEFYARNNEDVIRVAYEYIKKIKMQTGMRSTKIASVKVNGQHDITQKVMIFRETLNDDMLPF
jgi:hypothetical protein